MEVEDLEEEWEERKCREKRTQPTERERGVGEMETFNNGEKVHQIKIGGKVKKTKRN